MEPTHRNTGLKVDEDVQRRIETFAREQGSTPAEVVRAAFEAYESRQNGAREAEGEESAYEALKRTGLIGCLKGGPPDLSTNPKYLKGFGGD